MFINKYANLYKNVRSFYEAPFRMFCSLCMIQFVLLYGVFSADEFGTCAPSVTAGKSAENKMAALRKISSLVQKDFKVGLSNEFMLVFHPLIS